MYTDGFCLYSSLYDMYPYHFPCAPQGLKIRHFQLKKIMMLLIEVINQATTHIPNIQNLPNGALPSKKVCCVVNI